MGVPVGGRDEMGRMGGKTDVLGPADAAASTLADDDKSRPGMMRRSGRAGRAETTDNVPPNRRPSEGRRSLRRAVVMKMRQDGEEGRMRNIEVKGQIRLRCFRQSASNGSVFRFGMTTKERDYHSQTAFNDYKDDGKSKGGGQGKGKERITEGRKRD